MPNLSSKIGLGDVLVLGQVGEKNVTFFYNYPLKAKSSMLLGENYRS